MQAKAPVANTFKFRCGDCNQKLKVERDCSGKWTICPHCNEIIQIPQIKVASAVTIEEAYPNTSNEAPQGITDGNINSRTDSNTTSQAVQTFLKDTRTDGIPAEDVAWSAPVVDNSEDDNDDEEELVAESHSVEQNDTGEDAVAKTPEIPKAKSLNVKGKTTINVGASLKTKIKVNAKGKPKAKKFKKVNR